MPQPTYKKPFTKIYHKKPYEAIDPTKPSLSASGKTIVITAGHTGIGYSIAQNFAIAGAFHIIILARRVEILQQAVTKLSIEHPKTKFHFFATSITEISAIKKAFHDIRISIADPDILVTSAAYVAKPFPAMCVPVDELRASFETNVLGNMNVVCEFLDAKIKKKKIILDISSSAAHLYMPQISAYSVTKLAFTQWLSHLLEEKQDEGLRIHSFHPGGILTDAVRGFGMTEDSMDWDDVQLPGQFAVWLSSKEGGFLNGRFVWANWDVVELKECEQQFHSDKELLKIGLLGK